VFFGIGAALVFPASLPHRPAPSLAHDQHQGESYRLREKLKAGLLKPKLGADHGSDADASSDNP
jgi:hypothetical protein